MLVLLLVPDIGMRTDHYPQTRQRLSPQSVTVPEATGDISSRKDRNKS